MGKVAKFEAYPLILHCIHLSSAHRPESSIHGRVLPAVFGRSLHEHSYKSFHSMLGILVRYSFSFHQDRMCNFPISQALILAFRQSFQHIRIFQQTSSNLPVFPFVLPHFAPWFDPPQLSACLGRASCRSNNGLA